VLANRLSEDQNVTVLLLEAGKAEISLITDFPLAASMLQTTFSYPYVTEPQTKACLGNLVQNSLVLLIHFNFVC
jgi:choline dehydrogenase-like flavoprotein